ncbi:MAG: Flagellar hook-length control protein FliK [Myxococcales bacterium]|nr:Flagellar hook-length control protein FliK [Myxococcales bacterium]
MHRLLLVLGCLASCGRVGFSPLGGAVDDAGGDGPGTDGAPGDVPTDVMLVATGESRLTTAPGTSQLPAIVWTGTEAGIAWEDDRDGNVEIYFTRIDARGQRIGSDVRVTNAPGTSRTPSLVWTGVEYGIAWTDTRDLDEEIYFTRLAADGTKIGADTRITNDLQPQTSPSLQWSGTEWLVAWDDQRTGSNVISAMRLAANGLSVSALMPLTPGGATPSPDVMVTSTGYGLVYANGPTGTPEVFYMALDPTGARVGGVVQISPTATAGGSYAPSLARNGSELVIAYHDDRSGTANIYVQRIDLAGTRIGTETRVDVAPSSTAPAIASNGDGTTVCWYDFRNGSYDVFAARLDLQGTVVRTDVPVSTGGSYASACKLVAPNPSIAIVAWTDDRNGGTEIYIRIVEL